MMFRYLNGILVMFAEGTTFPTATLPSSKGGTVDLAEVVSRGPLVVAVVPRDNRVTWFNELSLRLSNWLLQRFVNVYLIADISPQDARDICAEYGIQAAILSDAEGGFYPHGEGIYRLNEAGKIEGAINEIRKLDALFD